MLDIKYIRRFSDQVKKAIQVKNIDLDLEELLSLDQELAQLKQKLQELNRLKNENAQKFKSLKEDKQKHKAIQDGREISSKIQTTQSELQEKYNRFETLMLQVPNIPSEDSPVGPDDTFNKVIREKGEIKNITNFKSHYDLLTQNNWADFQNIAQIAGSRSYCLKNQMIFLEQALIQFGLHLLKQKDFELMSLPNFGNRKAFIGSGHFPEGEEDVYYIEKDKQYLTGTAEVVLNSLYQNRNLSVEELPLRLAGLSPCFRREAGSAGRDVRGLLRVHQFIKLEQYIICANDKEQTHYWHKFLLDTSEEILQALELPYRVVAISTGDMGAGKYQQHDIECWLPSLKKYMETHSCSSLLDWQARRTGLRYRDRDKKMHYCHTLNNTALALPRLLAVFVENHQTSSGAVQIPSALQPYLNNISVLEPEKRKDSSISKNN